MIEFVEGDVVELAPTHVVINANGIGYFINISLNTYEAFNSKQKLLVLTHKAIKEDSHTLYGFQDKTEREVFRNLISVSGIGPATARMVLSSLSQHDIIGAIINGNVPLLKSIKGIGPKAAQRMILELKDKMTKLGGSVKGELTGSSSNHTEALEALTALGFGRSAAEKALLRTSKDLGSGASTEDLIKNSLKLL